MSREEAERRGLKPRARIIADVVVGTDPVSYTHLRAHETVLDLVCRLLLEKKKTDTQCISHTMTMKQHTS